MESVGKEKASLFSELCTFNVTQTTDIPSSSKKPDMHISVVFVLRVTGPWSCFSSLIHPAKPGFRARGTARVSTFKYSCFPQTLLGFPGRNGSTALRTVVLERIAELFAGSKFDTLFCASSPFRCAVSAVTGRHSRCHIYSGFERASSEFICF